MLPHPFISIYLGRDEGVLNKSVSECTFVADTYYRLQKSSKYIITTGNFIPSELIIRHYAVRTVCINNSSLGGVLQLLDIEISNLSLHPIVTPKA